MFKALCQDAQRDGLSACDRLIAALTIDQDAGKIGNLTDPTPILFPLEFDRELHSAFSHGLKLIRKTAYCLTKCA